MSNLNLAILVVSCDKYADVWKPFFDLFFKYWPDCPYKIYLGVNNKDFEYPKVNVIKTGEDISWADNYKKMLENIKEEYILNFLEDFLFCKPVDSNKVTKAYEFAIHEDITCYRLIPRPKGSGYYKNNLHALVVSPYDDYCITTQTSIWNKDVLMGLMKQGYTAWEFEYKNTNECKNTGLLPGVIVTHNETLFSIKNGVIRNKWVPSSLRYCKKVGIEVKSDTLGVMTKKEVIKEQLKMIGKLILPKQIKKIVKRIMIKMGFKFVTFD